jgi:sugar transferase (PEP-CTERM/EpsH1 system associated)
VSAPGAREALGRSEPPSRVDILFVAPRLPWPLDYGAKIRTYHLLRALGRRYAVSFLAFADPELGAEAADAIRPLVSRLELVPRRQDLAMRARDAVLGLRGPLPYVFRTYERDAMAHAVRAVVERSRPRLVHCDHLHMGIYGAAAGIPYVVDEHNVESVLWHRWAKASSGLRARLFAEQARLLTRHEARIAGQAWRCLVTSETDGHELQRIARARVAVVPNGVDVAYFSDPAVKPVEQGALVLTGTMLWRANEDAAVWFAREILPAVRRALPGARFAIVGRKPGPRVRRLAAADVVVTGTVPDVRPYLRGARALVVPLRVAGGTRLKILEAFAARVPVVSTRIGAEGIDCAAGREILFAETPDEFAVALSRLEADASLRQGLVERASILARRYDWDAIGRDLVRLYEPAPEREAPRPSRWSAPAEGVSVRSTRSRV